MSSISSISSRPSPVSSTEPSSPVGSAPGARSVLNTTNSWTSSGPSLVTSNVTSPAAIELSAGTTANSWSVTATVPPPSSELHAAAPNPSTPARSSALTTPHRAPSGTSMGSPKVSSEPATGHSTGCWGSSASPRYGSTNTRISVDTYGSSGPIEPSGTRPLRSPNAPWKAASAERASVSTPSQAPAPSSNPSA